MQDCGKKDPFSPQARWGDDGARSNMDLPTGAYSEPQQMVMATKVEEAECHIAMHMRQSGDS